MMKDNHVLSYALGILFSFCLIVTLLITSVEAVTYWTPGGIVNICAVFKPTKLCSFS